MSLLGTTSVGPPNFRTRMALLICVTEGAIWANSFWSFELLDTTASALLRVNLVMVLNHSSLSLRLLLVWKKPPWVDRISLALSKPKRFIIDR